MAQIFVDESIHERAGVIIAAAVYAKADLNTDIADALSRNGFRPGLDEFKSSMLMAGNASGQRLRTDLRHILMTCCQVATVVCTLKERSMIGAHVAELLNSMGPPGRGVIYFDEGIKFNSVLLPEGWTAKIQCDSRSVLGIQIADCAASLLGVMLLTELGIVDRKIEIDDHVSGEPLEVELAWQLWTSLRYALASGDPEFGYREDGWCEPMMKPFGLLISEQCSPDLRRAAERRFGSVWAGCIN